MHGIGLVMISVLSIHFLTKICAKNGDLNRWPLDHKFALLVTVDQRCVSTKLEASTAFPFRENWKIGGTGRTDGGRDRRTDGRGATLNTTF